MPLGHKGNLFFMNECFVKISQLYANNNFLIPPFCGTLSKKLNKAIDKMDTTGIHYANQMQPEEYKHEKS